MAIQKERYKQLLINLLPLGRLWETRSQPTLDSLIFSLADEFCRVDERVDVMLKEADPRTSTELLESWERLVGLPDECTPLSPSESGRRNQVVQKYTNVGGISAAVYKFIAKQLGVNIAVKDIFPFYTGFARVGDRLTNDFDFSFRIGDRVGEPLHRYGWRFWFEVNLPRGHTVLECVLRKLKPAHVGILFYYED